jgi:hypothetical protein
MRLLEQTAIIINYRVRQLLKAKQVKIMEEKYLHIERS